MEKMLTGVTVLELGQVIAGNVAGVILADMGAEVIKVEPITGDTARNPGIAGIDGESAIHLALNRNKKSISLDLKSEAGRAIFVDLVRQADVVIDNFRPGVMARLGADPETLRTYKPDIITASVTGFGATGPAKNRPAFDLVVQALSGHLDITGEADRPPSRVGVPIADLAGGLFTCISVLGALAGRGLHGEGQHADVAMLDSLVSLLTYDGLHHLNSGVPVKRQGTSHAYMVPWQAFAVQDGYIVIAAREEKFWQRLCDAIGRPDLQDHPKTRDNPTRLANREFVNDLLEAAFAGKTRREWVAIMDEYDIPAAPVNELGEVFEDEQVRARGMVRTYDHATLGEVTYIPSPLHFDDWEFPNRPAPMLGQHTAEVLRGRLGLDDARIAELADAGVIRMWPPTDA